MWWILKTQVVVLPLDDLPVAVARSICFYHLNYTDYYIVPSSLSQFSLACGSTCVVMGQRAAPNALSFTSHVWVLRFFSHSPQKLEFMDQTSAKLAVIHLDFWETKFANRHSNKKLPIEATANFQLLICMFAPFFMFAAFWDLQFWVTENQGL